MNYDKKTIEIHNFDSRSLNPEYKSKRNTTENENFL